MTNATVATTQEQHQRKAGAPSCLSPHCPGEQASAVSLGPALLVPMTEEKSRMG